MRCDEAQSELARAPVDPVVQDALASHLASCPTFESVRRLYGRIDEVLAHEPAWAPPVEFGRRVVAGAPRQAPHRVPRRGILSPGAFDAAMPGLLVAVAGCVVGLATDASLIDAVPVTWVCATLSVWIGASCTRRAIRMGD